MDREFVKELNLAYTPGCAGSSGPAGLWPALRRKSHCPAAMSVTSSKSAQEHATETRCVVPTIASQPPLGYHLPLADLVASPAAYLRFEDAPCHSRPPTIALLVSQISKHKIRLPFRQVALLIWSSTTSRPTLTVYWPTLH